MLFYLVITIPLALAWADWFRVGGQRTMRRMLSATGLVLLSVVPVLSVIAIAQVASNHGRSSTVVHLEGLMFLVAALSIPFLLFGYRMTRWVGLVSAALLPIAASFVDSLY